MPGAGVLEARHALGQPFLLAPDRFRVFAAGKTRANGILELAADLQVVGGSRVYGGVLTVPRHIPALGIQDHDAFRQQVDGFEKSGLGGSRERQGRLDLGAADEPFHKFRADEWAGQASPSVPGKIAEAAELAPQVCAWCADGAGSSHE